MNINKKRNQEGERETASEIDLFKSKETGDLMYNTHYGQTVSLADKNYVNDTVSTAITDAIAEPMSTITFSADFKTIGPKVVFTKSDYGNEKDIIIPGQLEITRGNNEGIYNSILQEGYDNGGPTNTFWNSNFTDSTNYGWSKLGTVLNLRNFDTWQNSLDNNVGVNIIDKELVMVATGDGITLFFLVKFTQWTEGDNGGGFSYERYQIFPSTVFERPSNSPEVVDKISDGLIIKRNNTRGIFNAVFESFYDKNHYTSPKGTRWSSTYTDDVLGGSNDYSNVRQRKYGTWNEAVDGNPPNNLNTELIMHDLSTDLYWLVVFSVWGIGDNGDLGDVTYTRTLLPLDEGIRFSNGDYMTELPSSGTNTPVVDANQNVIIGDSSNNPVIVRNGATQFIPDFSGMLLVNDLYGGRVELWLAGSGDTVLVSYTQVNGGVPTNTLEISNNGYLWTNNDNFGNDGDIGITFTVIKTRLGS